MADASSIGYETSRIAVQPFSGNQPEWGRWKHRFLIAAQEAGIYEALTGSTQDKKLRAKAYRILFLSCTDQAADLLYSRVTDNDGHTAWH